MLFLVLLQQSVFWEWRWKKVSVPQIKNRHLAFVKKWKSFCFDGAATGHHTHQDCSSVNDDFLKEV